MGFQALSLSIFIESAPPPIDVVQFESCFSTATVLRQACEESHCFSLRKRLHQPKEGLMLVVPALQPFEYS
ncbi:hypothetical protein OMCYN_00034 [cyanobiont of Ornithocercus magnificus]|nr:hypothetical protein OMCYN_00034 [cyanobiont of Ornithocercus magnificus]